MSFILGLVKDTQLQNLGIKVSVATFLALVFILFRFPKQHDIIAVLPAPLGSHGQAYSEHSQINSPSENHTLIEKVCQHIRDGHYVIPNPELAVNRTVGAVVDHFHQVSFCPIPKAGSTSWLQLYGILIEKERKQRAKWYSQHPPYDWYGDRDSNGYIPYKEFGINQLSNGDDGREVRDGLPDPRLEYYKFLIARHPLERLASAYLDKVGRNKPGKRPSVKRMKDFGREPRVWGRDEIAKVTFEEFLKFVAQPDSELTEHIDIHFRTYQTTCEPCSIAYNYIGHLEEIWDDLEHILPHLNATEYTKTFPEKKLKITGDHKYAHMYTSLPMSILQPIFDKYQADADMFGYSFDKYKSHKS